MKIDNVSFNTEAVKEMSEEQFIELHMCLRPELSEAKRKKWLRMCYARIVK